MYKQLIACSLVVLFSAGLLLAHGDFTHLAGTVTAINGNHVTIKDTAGKSVMVMFGKTTKFLRDKKAAAGADMKVGTRVVIDATMDAKMKMYSAAEIQLGVVEPAKTNPK
jgi:hypothetical protein